MLEENKILLDEVIAEEPIKNTFRLAWEFIVLNKPFTFMFLAIFMLLAMMSLFVGSMATVISGILTMALQIYIARLVANAQNIEAFVAMTKKSKIEQVISENIFVAMGAYLAGILLLFMIMFFIFIMMNLLGVSAGEMGSLLIMMMFPILLIGLVFSYIQPLVQAKISRARDFKEGAMAVFSLFSLDLWRQSFESSYPKYILALMGIIMALFMLLGVVISFIPYFSLVGTPLMVFLMYGYIVVISIAAMVGDRMVKIG